MTLCVVLAVLTLLAYLASTPFVAAYLMRSLEDCPPLSHTSDLDGAQVIVVLGGDVKAYAPEYGGETVGGLTLQRLRYAALLHRQTKLPVLATGGRISVWREPVATHMRQSLAEDFHVETRWIEDQSRTTNGNAVGTAPILAGLGIRRICLVTHAFHMRRAKRSFERQGIEVVAAPTGFTARPTPLWNDFLPRTHAVHSTALACSEWGRHLLIALGLSRYSS